MNSVKRLTVPKSVKCELDYIHNLFHSEMWEKQFGEDFHCCQLKSLQGEKIVMKSCVFHQRAVVQGCVSALSGEHTFWLLQKLEQILSVTSSGTIYDYCVCTLDIKLEVIFLLWHCDLILIDKVYISSKLVAATQCVITRGVSTAGTSG